MANFYGTARSNAFRVKDEAAFRAWAEQLPGVEVDVNQEGRFMLLVNMDSDDGCFPSQILRVANDDGEETEDYEDFDLAEELSQHLPDGEVAILMQAGAEKLRYIDGWALAINNRGERRQISLYDIYALAAELTDRPLDVRSCTYEGAEGYLPEKARPRSRTVVVLEGGVVTGLVSDQPGQQIIVKDFDAQDDGGGTATAGDGRRFRSVVRSAQADGVFVAATLQEIQAAA